MIIEKILYPYILASQHPMLHMACLLTSVGIILIEREQSTHDFNQLEQLKGAYHISIANNAICILLQYLISTLRDRMYQRYTITEGVDKGNLSATRKGYNFSYLA